MAIADTIAADLEKCGDVLRAADDRLSAWPSFGH